MQYKRNARPPVTSVEIETGGLFFGERRFKSIKRTFRDFTVSRLAIPGPQKSLTDLEYPQNPPPAKCVPQGRGERLQIGGKVFSSGVFLALCKSVVGRFL